MQLATLLVDYPILREALSRAPGVTVRWERSTLTEAGEHQLLVWVDGGDDDLEAFDDSLEADPTVRPPTRTVAFDDRRLYQFALTDEGRRASVHPLVIEEGGILHEVTATYEGWTIRVAFPTDGSLERCYAFFVDRGLTVEVRQLYDNSETAGGPISHPRYGVTERQREALVAAVDAGYLDIPRSCSLAELGDRLGISPNATSERFRRGVTTLVENTVYSDDES
ncbi:helix-turn-helix domain-containing protein [Natronorubrum sp. FCH18a]|uniref:helix-turn-helix domain-containing protein n=1 Tax=Natronorubrum sp. FCH18a TaxID=3447018 RepID=UPI003F51069F